MRAQFWTETIVSAFCQVWVENEVSHIVEVWSSFAYFDCQWRRLAHEQAAIEVRTSIKRTKHLGHP